MPFTCEYQVTLKSRVLLEGIYIICTQELRFEYVVQGPMYAWIYISGDHVSLGLARHQPLLYAYSGDCSINNGNNRNNGIYARVSDVSLDQIYASGN